MPQGKIPSPYPELKYEKIRLFISEASKLVDYIILDCSSNMLNFFTPTAIEAADLTVRIITPDLQGLNYLRAHKPLLTDEKFHYDGHLTFAGLARPFHAIDEMDHLIGGFDGLLPYAKEIERCGTSGQMFKALAYCNQRYINSLKLVRERLEEADAKEVVSPDADIHAPETEPEEIWDTPTDREEMPDADALAESGRKERNTMGMDSLNDMFFTSTASESLSYDQILEDVQKYCTEKHSDKLSTEDNQEEAKKTAAGIYFPVCHKPLLPHGGHDHRRTV